MKKLNKKGFTIIELVIVIAVIAILAAVMVPTFSSIVEKANQSKALQEVKNAYTLTLAEELSDPTISESKYVVNGKEKIVVSHDGFIISISKNGEAKVANENENATYILKDGKLTLKDSTNSSTNQKNETENDVDSDTDEE